MCLRDRSATSSSKCPAVRGKGVKNLKTCLFKLEILFSSDRIVFSVCFGKDKDIVWSSSRLVGYGSPMHKKLQSIVDTADIPKSKGRIVEISTTQHPLVKKLREELCKRVDDCEGIKNLDCSAINCDVVEEIILSF